MIIAISNEVAVMTHIADRIGRNKKVVFIDTASNGQIGDKTWLENQIGAISNEYSDVQRYSIEGKNTSDFQKDLQNYDIIHIGGGNTAYLLFHILETGFDGYLREIYKSRIIIGSSAGAKVLGKNIGHVKALDDFSVVDLKNGVAVGLFNFDIWAHFGNEKYRENYTEVLDIAYKNSQSGVYISDNSYIISTEKGFEICNV